VNYLSALPTPLNFSLKMSPGNSTGAYFSGEFLDFHPESKKTWWEKEVSFFGANRMRTWIMVRRIAHTASHRGEHMTILRMLGREIHSIYGPSADTGGLPQNGALTIYTYPDIKSLIEGESKGGLKAPLPGPGNKPCTERPDS